MPARCVGGDRIRANKVNRVAPDVYSRDDLVVEMRSSRGHLDDGRSRY